MQSDKAFTPQERAVFRGEADRAEQQFRDARDFGEFMRRRLREDRVKREKKAAAAAEAEDRAAELLTKADGLIREVDPELKLTDAEEDRLRGALEVDLGRRGATATDLEDTQRRILADIRRARAAAKKERDKEAAEAQRIADEAKAKEDAEIEKSDTAVAERKKRLLDEEKLRVTKLGKARDDLLKFMSPDKKSGLHASQETIARYLRTNISVDTAREMLNEGGLSKTVVNLLNDYIDSVEAE